MRRLILLVFALMCVFSLPASAEEIIAAVFPPAGNCVDGSNVVYRTNPIRLECSAATSGVPAGVIAYFSLPACPTGWAMANGANGTIDVRGEFIRAWDAGRGVDAGRALRSFQPATGVSTEVWGARWVGIENHDGGYNSGITQNSSDKWEPAIARPFYRVRPRNVALLACQKL